MAIYEVRISELTVTTPKPSRVWLTFTHSPSSLLCDPNKVTSHVFSASLPELSFSGLSDVTTYNIQVFTSKDSLKSGKYAAAIPVTQQDFALWHSPSRSVPAVLSSPGGFELQIRYSISSPSLMVAQISDSNYRSDALADLSSLISAPKFIDYISHLPLVELVLNYTKRSVTRPKKYGTVLDELKPFWTGISANLRLLSRLCETNPTADFFLWSIIADDDGKHQDRYPVIFSLLKALSTRQNGAVLLPSFAELICKCCSQLDDSSHSQLLLQVIPLITYHDPKFIPFLLKKTDLLQGLVTGLKYVVSNPSSNELVDQLLALARFLGKENLQQLTESGAISAIQQLASDSSDAKLRLQCFQFLENMGVTQPQTSVLSLLDKFLLEKDPYARTKCLETLQASLKTNPPTEDERKPLLLALVQFLDLYWTHEAKQIIESLNPSLQECVSSGMVRLYTRMFPSGSEGVEWIFGFLLTRLASECVETLSEVGDWLISPKRRLNTRNVGLPGFFVEHLESIDFFNTLCGSISSRWGEPQSASQLLYWLSIISSTPSLKSKPHRDRMCEAFAPLLSSFKSNDVIANMRFTWEELIVYFSISKLESILDEKDETVQEQRMKNEISEFPLYTNTIPLRSFLMYSTRQHSDFEANQLNPLDSALRPSRFVWRSSSIELLNTLRQLACSGKKHLEKAASLLIQSLYTTLLPPAAKFEGLIQWAKFAASSTPEPPANDSLAATMLTQFAPTIDALQMRQLADYPEMLLLQHATTTFLTSALLASNSIVQVNLECVTLPTFNGATDFLLELESSSIVRETPSSPAWLEHHLFVRFLIETPDLDPKLAKLKFIVVNMALEVLEAQNAAAQDDNPQPVAVQSEPSDSDGNKPKAATTAIPLETNAYLRTLSQSPTALFLLLNSQLRSLVESPVFPEPSQLQRFAVSMLNSWPTLRNLALPCSSLADRIGFLWYLARLTEYVHIYHEACWIFDKHEMNAFVYYDNEYGYFHGSKVLETINASHYTSERFALDHTLSCRRYAITSNCAAYLLRKNAQGPFVDLNTQHAHPEFEWYSRMETLGNFMTVLMEMIDTVSLDNLGPLIPDGEASSAEEKRLSSYVQSTIGLFNISDPLPHRVRVDLTTGVIKFVVSAVQVIYSVAAYPCPSLSRRAAHWLVTSFFPRLHSITQHQLTINHFHDHGMAENDRATFNVILESGAAFLPQSIGIWLLVHYPNPKLITQLFKAFQRLSTDGSMPPGGVEDWAVLGHNRVRLPYLASGILKRYIDLFKSLLEDPIAWEARYICPNKLHDPEPIASTADLPPGMGVPRRLRVPFVGFLNQSDGYQLPLDTSNADTAAWTDRDELDWATRPHPCNPGRRISPLDIEALAFNNIAFFDKDADWTSGRPLVGMMELAAIPSDEAKRTATIEERVTCYAESLMEAISAISEYMCAELQFSNAMEAAPSLAGLEVNQTFLPPAATSDYIHPKRTEKVVKRRDAQDLWLLQQRMRLTEFPSPPSVHLERMPYLLSQWYARERLEDFGCFIAKKASADTQTMNKPVSSADFEEHVSTATSAPSSSTKESANPHSAAQKTAIHPTTKHLLLLPSMLDFAWKILSLSWTIEDAPLALKIQSGYTLEALLMIEKEAAENSRLQPQHPLWKSTVLPALSILLPYLPTSAHGSVKRQDSQDDGEVKFWHLPLQQAPAQLLDHIKVTAKELMNIRRQNSLLNDPTQQASSSDSVETPIPKMLTIEEKKAVLESCYPIAERWEELLQSLCGDLRLLSRLLRYAPDALDSRHLYRESNNSDAGAELEASWNPTKRELKAIASKSPALVFLAAVVASLLKPPTHEPWREGTARSEQFVANWFWNLLAMLPVTPEQTLRFLSDPFWGRFAQIHLDPPHTLQTNFNHRLVALATKAGVFDMKDLDPKSTLGKYRAAATSFILLSASRKSFLPTSLGLLAFVWHLLHNETMLAYVQRDPGRIAGGFRPDIVFGVIMDILNDKPERLSSLIESLPDAGFFGLSLRLPRWFAGLNKAKSVPLDRFLPPTSSSAPNLEKHKSKGSLTSNPNITRTVGHSPQFLVGTPTSAPSDIIKTVSRSDQDTLLRAISFQRGFPAATYASELLAVRTYCGLMKETDWDGIHSGELRSWYRSIGVGIPSLLSAHNLPSTFTLNLDPIVQAHGGLFVVRTGCEYPDRPLQSRYSALPYNRILNVWFDRFGTASPVSSKFPTGLLRYVLSGLIPTTDLPAFRLGWATKEAITELNAQPFSSVGDVPGSVGFSLYESCMFSEGYYLPITSKKGVPYQWILGNSPIYTTFDPLNRIIHFSTRCKSTTSTEHSQSVIASIPIPSLWRDTELFPVLSFAGSLSFNFGPFYESDAPQDTPFF